MFQRESSIGSDVFNIHQPRLKRRQSRLIPETDPELLKIFFETHGVTQKDIDIAFDMLSKDKKKIYHSDVKAFIATYFDNNPEEAMTLLNSWKEDVSKEQLESLLLNKTLMSSPYQNAFQVKPANQWFCPENGALSKSELRKFAARMNKYQMASKFDHRTLLRAFDFDKDGVIGLEDFKKITIQ